MNSESFAEYLAQPAKLYQLPYQEIKNLVAEYPYAGNLRLMLLIKSKIEQDPAFETHLHQLAAHTFDRDYLFDLDNEILKDMLDLATGNEERLELQQLSAIEEKELIEMEVAPLTEVAKPEYLAKAIPVPTVDEIDNNEIDVEQALEKEEKEIPEPTLPVEQKTAPQVKLEEEVLAPTTIEDAPKEEKIAPISIVAFEVPPDLIDDISLIPLLTTNGQARAKETFPAWKVFLQENTRKRLEHLKEKAKQNINAFNISTQVAAAKSVKEKPSVATETLAKLLERQGNYKKAIKMYEQLSLLNPEKSRYFAATIEKLKQNI